MDLRDRYYSDPNFHHYTWVPLVVFSKFLAVDWFSQVDSLVSFKGCVWTGLVFRESHLYFLIYKLVYNTWSLIFAQMELSSQWRYYGTFTEFYKKGRKINMYHKMPDVMLLLIGKWDFVFNILILFGRKQ